jgi:hypothetical protein
MHIEDVEDVNIGPSLIFEPLSRSFLVEYRPVSAIGAKMILEPAHRLFALAVPILMTKAEKKRLAAVLQATEYLFLENIALKLILEHQGVPNWQKLLDHLLSDKEMLSGVRLKFRDLYSEIERSTDPSKVLGELLGELPTPKKPH